jgi:LAO/AO transport system kinase
MSTRSESSALLTRLLGGEPIALARAITMIDNELPGHAAFLETMPDKPRTTPVVGFTGAPGVGKSTLINAYVAYCRSRERRVAVVSVDPSSPISGGAILGDRLRMAEHAQDDGVYIRSLASRGHLGGLCRNIGKVIRVIDTAGWDVIVLETVGTGQSEVEVASIADVKVVVNAPGMGDSVQAMKSGILEIADILVVNKADLPRAGKTTKELRAMLRLRSNSMTTVAVIETVATRHTGIDELSAAIDDCKRSGK